MRAHASAHLRRRNSDLSSRHRGIVGACRVEASAHHLVLSLDATGLTTGEISAHFAEVHGASVSRRRWGRITDRMIEEMTDWSVRPLDEVYAAVFIDAIVVKVRDDQVANRPMYAAIG